MIPAVRAVAALALVAAALPASAYVRETTTDTGLCLWWRGRQVTYAINAGGVTQTPCQGAALVEATAAGLAAWTSAGSPACTDFAFVQGQSTTATAIGNDGLNLVVFRTRRCVDLGCSGPACVRTNNCWDHEIGTIGFTTTTSDQETGEILDSDMELFAWDGVAPPDGFGFYLTCEAPEAPECSTVSSDVFRDRPTGCNATDVQAVVTHEAGHMLGLDHVPSGAVMAPTVGRVSQRPLQADDVAGVCAIYPTGASALTCLPGGGVPPPSSDGGGGGGGCSSAGGTGIAGLLAAALVASRALRRRR